jgi:tRNA(Ile)-lysidine synthase TilS/MesJ
LLDLLLDVQKRAPVKFEILAVNLDQKQPGFPEHVLPEYLENLGVNYKIIEEDTYSIVTRLVPEGKTFARFARVCGAEFFTQPLFGKTARKSRSGITPTTLSIRFC